MARSSAKKSSRSAISTSRWSPTEAMAEKPTPRPAAHSIMLAAMAPDCEISARSPDCGMRAAKLALNLAAGDRMPRQFGPTMRRPLRRAAISIASAIDPGPWPSPAVITMAVAQPVSAAASIEARTCCGGTATTTASAGAGSSANDARAGIPSIDG